MYKRQENDKLSEAHLADIRKELAEKREQFATLKARWETEKDAIKKVQSLREEMEKCNAEMEQAERSYDLNRAAELKYGKLPKLQEELAQREFSASAGGGAVKATVTGAKLLKALEIDPDCVDPEDLEMLQDMILAAVNEALRTAEETVSAEMGKLTGGMGLGF